MPEKTVLASVRGRVQGVGFRWWTEDEARALSLRGWVKNEPDGSVTALLSGPAEAVDDMLARLRIGPAAARVESVTAAPADPAGLSSGFRQIR